MNVNILHVDDDESQLELIKLIIEEGNPHVTVVSVKSPSAALEELEKKGYDCIISDYNMPGLNGLQLAKKIREKTDVPIILYTGRGSEEVAEKAFTSGVDSYVMKDPTRANCHLLAKSIQNLVEKHRAKTLLTESEKRYRKLVEESPLPISVTTGDLIVYVNKKRAELTGHNDPESIVGMSGLTYVHPEDKGHVLSRLSARTKGDTLSQVTSFRLRRVDGTILYVEDHMSDIIWDGEPSVLHSLVDFTERVLYEAQLGALHSYGARMANASDASSVAEICLDAVMSLIGFSSASFGVVEDDKVVFVRALGLDPFGERVYRRDGRGVSVRAVNTGEIQHVRDTRLDGDYLSYYADDLHRFHLSEMDVPVLVDGEPVAVINVEHVHVDAFTFRDVRLLELLAVHVASAFKRLREEDRRKRYTSRLEALHLHACMVDSVGSLGQMAEATVNTLLNILDFEHCSFSVVEGDYLHLRYKNAPGRVRVLSLGGAGVTVRAVNTGRTQLVPDVRVDPDYVCGENASILSELAVPVKVEGRVQAVINIESKTLNGFTEEEVHLVEMLAQHVSSTFMRLGK